MCVEEEVCRGRLHERVNGGGFYLLGEDDVTNSVPPAGMTSLAQSSILTSPSASIAIMRLPTYNTMSLALELGVIECAYDDHDSTVRPRIQAYRHRHEASEHHVSDCRQGARRLIIIV